MSRTRLAAVLVVSLISAGCSDGPGAPGPEEQRAYHSERRAWLPGERDSTIARIKANREFDFPLVGDISDEADIIFADTDSVTVMVNDAAPAAAPSPSARLLLAPQFSTAWTITGVDVRLVNKEVTPNDTTHWIGVFWSNPAETTWKGFVLAAANSNPATVTLAMTTVNTNVFDAAFGKAGVGGGEMRAGTTTFWQANGGGISPNNTLTISAASYGAAATVTTGPFLGGTAANGTMQGRMRTINMTRISGATNPATFTVDMDFSAAAISSIRYVCVFRTPCTTNK